MHKRCLILKQLFDAKYFSLLFITILPVAWINKIAKLIKVCTLISMLVRLIHNNTATTVVYTIFYINILLKMTIVE